ncbi:MAG: flavodoxin-dependent (E)-4-hydroxy-3-methylbut-2-enyl-diphosphate synthase [Proteobacteria bacterium]|nr:flavodoxin-dependent (E)-4-hydroxy-3-methylbut-2-enyl-diphosphate synthase [Pseudomonadota bacterium]
MIKRKITKKIWLGNVAIGGGEPVIIQSMTNTLTKDVKSTIRQIKALWKLGCEVIRVAIPDEESTYSLKEITKKSPMPVIADIHFDYKLAIESIKQGAHGIRINPGNIKNREKIKEILNIAKEYNTCIRIGVNSGSLDYDLRRKYKENIHLGLVESAINYIKFFEDNDFTNIKVSLKSADVITTILAYEKFSEISDYPLHLGITEAGTELPGTIRSSIGIGYLLLKGIGDTIRVSLTAPPSKEIIVAKEILKNVGLRKLGPILISCPTCARRDIDVILLAHKVEKLLSFVKSPIKVAVMGCAVNGPGEAMDADIGIAGSKEGGIIFKKGRVFKKIKNDNELLKEFLKEIKMLDKEWQNKEES